MTIAPLAEVDLAALIAIEKRSFPLPNSRESYLAELRNTNAYLLGAKHAFDDTLLGYINFWIFTGECHLHTLAVHPSSRRQGIADRLFQAMLDIASDRAAKEIYLEVRASNHAALALYEKHRFTRAGYRRNYYADNHEDALLLYRHLDSVPPLAKGD